MGRPVRGSRGSSFYSVDENPSLATLDSAFQLQEYISLLVRLDPHDVQRIVALPGGLKRDPADAPENDKLLSSEDDRPIVDEACWIYEQLRRLAQDLTHPLITTLQQECTRQTCPEMKAGEWLYLCVAHGNSGGMEHCCAIDYIVHTLDSATALLNSPRAFPSRISIPSTSHRHFPSLARRLGRIFAHAYHHHRAAFETAEAEGALYARFLALAHRFDLVPPEFLVIPTRRTDADVDPEPEDAAPQRVALLTRENADSTSPRIGGRARTDTMYLSDGFSPASTDSLSPRRIPSPMAGTLLPERGDDIALPDAGSEVHEKPRVIVRDFAVPQSSVQMPVRDQTPDVDAPSNDEKNQYELKSQYEKAEAKDEDRETEEEKEQEENANAKEQEENANAKEEEANAKVKEQEENAKAKEQEENAKAKEQEENATAKEREENAKAKEEETVKAQEQEEISKAKEQRDTPQTQEDGPANASHLQDPESKGRVSSTPHDPTDDTMPESPGDASIDLAPPHATKLLDPVATQAVHDTELSNLLQPVDAGSEKEKEEKDSVDDNVDVTEDEVRELGRRSEVVLTDTDELVTAPVDEVVNERAGAKVDN